MRAREVALGSERPVVFDPNLRLHRWRSRADAAASANACVPGALLVRSTDDEAAIMTGEDDPERAARALVKAGARMVVISLGADGAILRGELRADVDGMPVRGAEHDGRGRRPHRRPAGAPGPERLLSAVGGRGPARGRRRERPRLRAVGGA